MKLAMMFMSEGDKEGFEGGDMSKMLPEGMQHIQTIGKIMEELGNEYPQIAQGEMPPVSDVVAFFERRMTEEGVP